MDFITIVAVALGLSFDSFAVSLSMGVVQSRMSFRKAVRFAMILALFQAGLLLIGFFLGSFISEALKAIDHWIALVLLSILGVKMIIEGYERKKDERPRDNNHPMTVLTMAVGTSIDAFAVGISFAFLQIRIWYSALIIGAVTFLASMLAIRIGKYAGDRLGNKVEIIGGLILIAIGIKIFLQHVLGA